MSSGRRSAGPDRPDARARGLALEPLVQLVLALDGERAEALLAGVAEPLHRWVTALLHALAGRTRAERHAALAVAFAPQLAGGPRDGLPGALGEAVREALAPGAARPGCGAGPPEQLQRWARRLVREMGQPCDGDGESASWLADGSSTSSG